MFSVILLTSTEQRHQRKQHQRTSTATDINRHQRHRKTSVTSWTAAVDESAAVHWVNSSDCSDGRSSRGEQLPPFTASEIWTRKQLSQFRKQLDQVRKQLGQFRKQLDQVRKQLDQVRKQLDQAIRKQLEATDPEAAGPSHRGVHVYTLLFDLHYNANDTRGIVIGTKVLLDIGGDSDQSTKED
ncbi:unnamed protein product [Gongylonema pulchrum]|uniref:Fibrinogen C-terminal domain-containing protein n=1 Tax=Gongylonema pulchrum TaxID=637853 RepID=A0A183DZM8_9BILA|nr:unnamed protein product [Gongylonema pulchrum]